MTWGDREKFLAVFSDQGSFKRRRSQKHYSPGKGMREQKQKEGT